MTTDHPAVSWRTYWRALRVNQWTKNAVVFAAFFFALGDRFQTGLGAGALARVALAAALFCLTSSGIYLLNDVRDAELDRAHPVKRRRPVASGELPVPAAWRASGALLTLGLVGAALLSRGFLLVLGSYVSLQILYSFALKQIALVDLLVIAAGFVLRALAGAVVIHVHISPWLLLCAFWLALFLALCKRRHEKVALENVAASTRPSLANYNEKLLDQLIAIVSGITIVTYALYTLWPDTVAKFGTTRLGFTVPFVVFGIFRYLDLVYRHEQGDRPEKILLSDGPLLLDVVLYGLAVLTVLWSVR